jgi:hypothetical protein
MQGLPIRDWLSDFYPGLMTLPEGNLARPLECVQLEGELLYVPEGWYHATVNLGDTVAVASQRSHDQSTAASDMIHVEHQLWSDAKDSGGKGDNEAALASWDKLLAMNSAHNEAVRGRNSSCC